MKLKDPNAFTTQDLLHLFLNEKRLNPVYLAYFLSESGSKKLKNVFHKFYIRQDKKIKEKEQFGHITLKFAPSSPELLHLMKDETLPLKINVLLKRLYILPGGISAFTVELPPEIKKHFPQLKNPHITAFHSSERQPFQSNALISDPKSLYIDIEHEHISVALHLGVFGNPYDSPQKMRQGMLHFLQNVSFKNIWKKKEQELKKEALQQQKKKTDKAWRDLQTETKKFLH